MSPFVKVCDFFNDYFYVEWLCQTSLTLFNSRPTAVNTTWQMSQLQLYAVLCKVFKSIDTHQQILWYFKSPTTMLPK